MFFWPPLFPLRMLSLWKGAKQAKLRFLITPPWQRVKAGEKERKDGGMKMLDSVSADSVLFQKKTVLIR